MRVDVTQEDIDRGKRNSCCFCPVARAIRRAMTLDVGEVSVDGRFVIIRCRGVYSLPQAVQDFVKLFDNFETCVEPFSFELDYAPQD